MLERARAETHDAAITYTRADMEHLELSAASFDLAYSSLAFHYIEDLRGLMSQVHRALIAGGHLVFSVEHPIFTAPSDPKWSVNAAGRATWPVDGYLDEGPRSTDWLAKGVIKQHRTIATYINTLVERWVCRLRTSTNGGQPKSRSRRILNGPMSISGRRSC